MLKIKLPLRLRRTLIVISFISGLAFWARADDSVGEITFTTQAALGNIFVEGEKAELQAAIQSGTSVDWTVTDYEDKPVANGTTPVIAQKVSITPGVTGKGYYLVNLTSKDATGTKGQAKTSFAIIAPLDPKKTPDLKFGVNTHFDFGMPTDFLPLMQKIGIGMVRDTHDWAVVEKQRGHYDYSGVGETYMGVLKQYNLTPLTILAFGNPLYDAQPNVPPYQLAPYSAEGIAAYANYCADVVKHFPDQIKYVSIWNEYNGSFAGGKAAEDRPKSYTAMLKAAYTQIKADRPDVTVLGGAAVKMPLPYMEKLFKEGALPYLDALDVHPYQDPEGVDDNVAGLVALTKKYNHGQSKPIWVTEASQFGDETVKRASAASYLVRMYTLLLTQPEVQHIFWYLARDYRQEFHNLGIVHNDTDPMGKFTPVMTYPTLSNLIHLLSGARFNKREEGDSRTRLYRFDTDSQTVWVAWSTSQEAHLTFTASGPIKLVNIVGGETALTPSNGQVALTVSGDLPVYIVAEKGVVASVAEVPRKDQVLADSVRDFSGEQGNGGWSYLYFGSNQDGSAPYDPSRAQPMKWTPSPGDWADEWTGPGDYYELAQGSAHPGGIAGGQGWSILRWTSDRSGPIHLVGKAARGPDGDGVGVKVILEGKCLYDCIIEPGASADLNLPLTVDKGSRLDVVVTPGTSTDTSFDATTMHVTILTASP